ncbi:MAG TPA: tyrosine-type recombinase/integrase [Planctomycetaceae bacterium]|nr:tyrosine-type recombinase/integrase [Planctomycetaceae bacterium]
MYLGPRAQEIVRPFLRTDLQAYLFSPKDSEAWHREQRAAARKTLISCGNRAGTNRRGRPGRKPGDSFSVDAYRRSIAFASERAFAMPADLKLNAGGNEQQAKERSERRAAWRAEHVWHPHQLLHSAATRLRKTHGLEAAQVNLGHKTISVTQQYTEQDTVAAMKIMQEVG